MKKQLLSLGLLLALAVQGYSQGSIETTFNRSASGSTSCTAIVPEGTGAAEIRDLAYKVDAGLTTGTVAIRVATGKKAVTSATSASGTQLWFANTGTVVATSGYVIYFCAADSTYNLLRATAATTTSITSLTTISQATTVNDFVYPLAAQVDRPVTATQTASIQGIWIPKGLPAALTLDGNTTACRLSVSGVRSNYK